MTVKVSVKPVKPCLKPLKGKESEGHNVPMRSVFQADGARKKRY